MSTLGPPSPEAERKMAREDLEVFRAHMATLRSALQTAGLTETPKREPAPHPVGRRFGLGLLAGAARAYGYSQPQTLPRCYHPNAVPVELVVTGEVVARLCPDCDEQVPIDRGRWPGGMI